MKKTINIKYISNIEAAKLLGITTNTLRKYREDNKIVAYGIARKVYFNYFDIINYKKNFD
jgi:hypothetical protein